MKIGLLFGSFDPIHMGHISIASCVLNSKLCDKVLFVVANHNPWKSLIPAPFDIRCEMVRLSITGLNERCEVCDIERDIEPPTYTYKTIEKIQEIYPDDEFYLIAGTDTIMHIKEWKYFDTKIKDKLGYIEVKRNDGVELDNDSIPFIVRQKDRKDLGNKKFWFIKSKRIDVSSTMIRYMVANGMNPLPYITKETYELILFNKLYTGKT